MIQTPEWVRDAVFYQIFPDRFAKSPSLKKPSNLEPWNSPPTSHGFKGGDLLGVVEHLDHIQELGANAIYFCPIFQSAANHRYHTYDYFNVDPLLGGNQALRVLLDEAHRRDMRVILDGVFNHASRGFFQFHDILENGRHSPYIDWFTVRSMPLNAYDERVPPNYDAWWSLHALPKFNISNADVREYLMRVGEFWVQFGIDGWRLDVPAEINDDSFWREFRTRVKALNPEAYIVGEIWHEARRWLQGDQFDAVMNYLFTRLCIEFFIGGNVDPALLEGSSLWPVRHIEAAEFGKEIDALLKLYSREITEVQMNLLDSHDTARYLTMARGDQTALRLATLFQMAYPGAPSVYYADEIGMPGGKDPLSRASFPWDQSTWDTDLLAFFKRTIALRHAHPALRRGDYHTLFAQGSVYVMARQLEGDMVVLAFNVGTEPISGAIPVAPFLQNGMQLRNEWTGQTLQVEGGLLTLNMPARSGTVLALAGAAPDTVTG
ncbi:MAG: cyclomaltodextrinase / maltogenic alpha-amylase / neopullulanase [Chloroflexia bacterium]|jgi:glycosidase|nr:cyclomaltodextrinase / maltogenic alpha-amylase / neopullulanase [Chloroflexia bacterium]